MVITCRRSSDGSDVWFHDRYDLGDVEGSWDYMDIFYSHVSRCNSMLADGTLYGAAVLLCYCDGGGFCWTDGFGSEVRDVLR